MDITGYKYRYKEENPIKDNLFTGLNTDSLNFLNTNKYLAIATLKLDSHVGYIEITFPENLTLKWGEDFGYITISAIF